MANLEEVACCGIMELNGVQRISAMEALIDAANDYFSDTHRAFIFFSVISTYSKKGKDLASLIKKEKLGTVIKTNKAVNKNTNNELIMYVWTVNKTNFNRFWKKHGDYSNDENY